MGILQSATLRGAGADGLNFLRLECTSTSSMEMRKYTNKHAITAAVMQLSSWLLKATLPNNPTLLSYFLIYVTQCLNIQPMSNRHFLNCYFCSYSAQSCSGSCGEWESGIQTSSAGVWRAYKGVRVAAQAGLSV